MTATLEPPRVSPSAQLDRDNPWPGLDSYDESSYGFFSGRTAEARELLRRIVDEPVTVLFGKSGLGKTSLLKAGVFPALREKDLLPVFVRLQIRPGSEPLINQVRHALLAELRGRRVEHPEPAADETLWEYLHRSGLEFWTRQNRLVRAVFVFDQFEELFTHGASMPAEVVAFQTDLADLAENRIPASVATRLEQHATNRPGLNIPEMPYRIVIALREDFLADLEEWRLTMPSLRRNRMRLLPMAAEQAFEAVCNERTTHLVPEALGRRIVKFLSSSPAGDDGKPGADMSGPAVEPALLSLFCRGVNEQRKRAGKTQFDEALIDGGKGTIVSDFYKSSLADQPDRVRRFIEDELVTEHGFRNSYSAEDAVARRAVTPGELATLIDRHLLRHEHHLGTERVELTHDLLTAAVVEGRDQRRRADTAERERRRRWKRAGAVAIAGALLVVPLLIVLYVKASRAEDLALRASERATAASQRSKSRELGALAASATRRNPELAVALALAGLEQAGTAEARSALMEAARYLWPWTHLAAEDVNGPPRAVSLGDDGTRLVVLAGESVTFWDVSRRPPVRLWPQPVVIGPSTSVALSPDNTRIAVGRQDSIVVIDSATGRTELTQKQNAVSHRAVIFSPDGGWLAWTLPDQKVGVLDLANPEQAIPPADTDDAAAFALHAGGNAITTVSQFPLRAGLVTRQGMTWTQQPFDVSTCAKLQSVSVGARYLSATYNAGKCAFGLRGDDRSPARLPGAAFSTDVVWSTSGSGFADVLQSEDVIVGRIGAASGLENRMSGGHPVQKRSDLTAVVSVSDAASRLAYIDADDAHARVVIFSLGMHKPFMTGVDRQLFTVSPDGTWWALVRPGPGDRAVIDIVPIDGSFPAGHLSQPRTRIALEGRPSHLDASATSLVVGSTSPSATTTVYNLDTGLPRRAPYPGSARAIGETGELLLLDHSETDSWKVVRTLDGTEVAAWDRIDDVILSPGAAAIALIPRKDPGGSLSNTQLYAIAGTSLKKTGEASGVWLPWGTTLSDDGRSLRSDERTYTVDAAPTERLPEQADDAPTQPFRSATGRFEVQVGAGYGETIEAMTLIRRDGNAVVRRFMTKMEYRFSSDDTWLAIWDSSSVQVMSLLDGATFIEARYPGVDSVRFVASNQILNVGWSGGTALVPLDEDLIKRLARWLTPRVLSDRERCLYGLAGDDCR